MKAGIFNRIFIFTRFIPKSSVKFSIWVVFRVAILLLLAPATLHTYPRAYEPLWRFHVSLGLSNLAAPEDAKTGTKKEFTFSNQLGFSRNALMPQGDLRLSVLLRNRYILHFQLVLDNLRNQQGYVAFGLGNENAGLLLGLAQEYTVASQKRQLGFGIYAQAFSRFASLLDLYLETSLLTNGFDNSADSYQNIYVHTRLTFLIAQFRLGLLGNLNLFRAVPIDLLLLQLEGKLLFGGSAPGRLFSLDFYLSVVGLVNRGEKKVRYALLFFGLGLKLNFVLRSRSSPGIYFAVWLWDLPIEGIAHDGPALVPASPLGVSAGFTMDFRFAPKSLWMPSDNMKRRSNGKFRK